MKKLLGFAGVFHLLLIATLGVFVQAAPARIINGELAKEGDYPYFAQTFNTNGGGCGGSLIDERWVLTAAHCLRITSVIVGSITNGDVGANGIEAFCTEYIPHPNYDGNVINDVALCKLDRDVLIDNSRIMLELNQEENFPDDGSDIRVMGFGRTIDGDVDSSPENLMDVNLKIVSNDDCNEAWWGDIEPQMICASETGKDSCQGDSGGPLVQRRDNGDGTFTDTQVGIVSFGMGCADPYFPGVNARVSFFYDNFIISTICSGDFATPNSPLCQSNLPIGFPSNAPSSPNLAKCNTMKKKKKCNESYGCNWRWRKEKKNRVCKMASSTAHCSAFAEKSSKTKIQKRRCFKLGCVWKKETKKCVGRWD